MHNHDEPRINLRYGFGDFRYLRENPPAPRATVGGPFVYMVNREPYNPMDTETLNYGFGNLVAERIDNNTPAGDFYFKERGSGKILCWRGGRWERRDDTNHSGCFFFLNGALATFNPEEPGEAGNGVAEFRVSRIGNA